MELNRPIFIIGTGRCGSTLLHEILVHHPQVAFLSTLCARYPGKPQRNRWAMHLLDVPLIKRLARRRFLPDEAWPFWEQHCRGFSRPCRDLMASDVRPHIKQRLAGVLQEMVTRQRSRLLIKLTGWPRTGFLSEIFPDAHFIHLLRDGRAVANSLMDTEFWLGYRGPRQWRWGDLSADQQLEWERSGKSFVTLAAMQWTILMDAFEKARDLLPASRYLSVNYSQLVADPKGVFGDVLSFCQLDYPQEFKAAIDTFEFEDADCKWQQQLLPHQRQQLEAVLAEPLARWGFLPVEDGRELLPFNPPSPASKRAA
jgi:omega-hydroxy-beta-dihydromenaquinone-9 sulfotransferase